MAATGYMLTFSFTLHPSSIGSRPPMASTWRPFMKLSGNLQSASSEASLNVGYF